MCKHSHLQTITSIAGRKQRRGMEAASMLDHGNEEVPLPEGYVLQPYDVICGRHKFAFNNVGNRRFRVTISTYVQEFLETRRRQDRTFLFMRIVALIRQSGGKFLKFENKRWVDVGNLEARKKVGHALRDVIRAKGLPVRTNREMKFPSGAEHEQGDNVDQDLPRKRFKTCSDPDHDRRSQSLDVPKSVIERPGDFQRILPATLGDGDYARLKASNIPSINLSKDTSRLSEVLQSDPFDESESSVESIDSLTQSEKRMGSSRSR